MKNALLIASGIALAAFATTLSDPGQAKTMKECAAQWKDMKAANQTNGMKYRDFSKQCMSEGAPAAEAPPPPKPAAAAPPAKPTAAAPPPAAEKPAAAEKPGTPGRQAMLNRLHACSAEWKTMKAENKRPPGMKWPQFWHECDGRKKAEGM